MIPHITIEQAKILCANPANADLWVANQNALIDAYNKANAPHAELKAMYEQQVKDGTLDDFVWEFKNCMNSWLVINNDLGTFYSVNQYRCTPKPTCQVQFINGFESGEVITMTREKAKLLQAETKDTCDWFAPSSAHCSSIFVFSEDGIYTYKLKGTVKLTIDDNPAKMLTPAQCEAERLARIDTHDVLVKSKFTGGKFIPVLLDNPNFRTNDFEYQLRAKPLKQVWTGSREDVIALLNDLNVLRGGV